MHALHPLSVLDLHDDVHQGSRMFEMESQGMLSVRPGNNGSRQSRAVDSLGWLVKGWVYSCWHCLAPLRVRHHAFVRCEYNESQAVWECTYQTAD